MEHPAIQRTLMTGYPKKEVEHCGIDSMNNEILPGDAVIEFENGDVVIREALDDYLKAIGCRFYTAE